MSAAAASGVVFDVLRDSRHRDARAARACADWLAWLGLEGKAPRTLDDYERTVAALLRAFPDTAVEDFTHGDVLQVLRQSFTMGPGIRTRIAHLRSFFGYLELMGDITTSPMRRVPRPRRPQQAHIETFTDQEIDLLEGLPSPDGVLFAILFGAGLRKGEARRLQVGHVKLERGELVVYKGKGDKDRVVRIGTGLVQTLADFLLLEGLNRNDHWWYRRGNSGRGLFRDKPIGEGTFHRWYGECLEKAGVDYRNPHVTRHTYASRWIRRGGRIETLQEQMGHASIQTTRDLYVHLRDEDVRVDLELVEG